MGNVREVTSCFLVLRLLFSQEPGQGDDIRVDSLSHRTAIALLLAAHCCEYDRVSLKKCINQCSKQLCRQAKGSKQRRRW
jgi:hypothetical protein